MVEYKFFYSYDKKESQKNPRWNWKNSYIFSNSYTLDTPFLINTVNSNNVEHYFHTHDFTNNDIKIKTMINALISKFTQYINLHKILINDIKDTDYLVYDSDDSFWGYANGIGNNFLGKILTLLHHKFKYGTCSNISSPLKQILKSKPKSDTNVVTKVVNVQVEYLRKLGYKNLKEWVDDNNKNVYIARRGVILLQLKPGEKKRRYPEKDSIWANPFKIDKNEKNIDKAVDDVVINYEHYIREKLKNNPSLKSDLLKLKGKNLGCWCIGRYKNCHGNVLVKLINELF